MTLQTIAIHPICQRRTRRHGFSMVEVALALGIATYVLVSIFGVLNVAFATQQSSARENEAAHLATAIISDLRQASGMASDPTSPLYDVNLSAGETSFYLDETGQRVGSVEGALYAVKVQINPPTQGSRAATTGRIVLSWPAGAEEPTGTETFFVALNRN